jgi:hypothetical protein
MAHWVEGTGLSTGPTTSPLTFVMEASENSGRSNADMTRGLEVALTPPDLYPAWVPLRHTTDTVYAEWVADETICGWEIADRCRFVDGGRAPDEDWSEWFASGDADTFDAYVGFWSPISDPRAYTDLTSSDWSIDVGIQVWGESDWTSGTFHHRVPAGQPWVTVLDETQMVSTDLGASYPHWSAADLYTTGDWVLAAPPSDSSFRTDTITWTWPPDGVTYGLVGGWSVHAPSQSYTDTRWGTFGDVKSLLGFDLDPQLMATLTTTTTWRWLYSVPQAAVGVLKTKVDMGGATEADRWQTWGFDNETAGAGKILATDGWHVADDDAAITSGLLKIKTDESTWADVSWMTPE